MKKILSIFGVLLFVGSFVFTSCNTTNKLCPAYPPTVYHGDIQQNDDNQKIKDIEIIEIQQEKNL